MEIIKNRIQKNFRRLKGWAKSNRIEAYRLYDRDIPEFQSIVDRYADNFVLYNKGRENDSRDETHFLQTIRAIETIWPEFQDNIYVKKRVKQKELNQYEKVSSNKELKVIKEGPAKFYINLEDYLDTGLFLDHRPLRQTIYKVAKNKDFLNLFSYTCSVSVFAALSGAKTTNVDMSNTYLDWGRKNFSLNNINLNNHQFVRENVISFLQNDSKKFNIIFCDPPTFSNSKKLSEHFEVEEGQIQLIELCMNRLATNGILYFSTNKRSFKLAKQILLKYHVLDISKETIPKDFHDLKIHQCFKITFREGQN